MEEHHGGSESADTIACLGMAAVDGATDGLGHHRRLREQAHVVHFVQSFRLTQGGILVGRASRALGQMLCGDDTPLRLDATGFYHHHVDTKRFHLHPQGVTEGLDGELRHVVPAPEIEHGLADHRSGVDDPSHPAHASWAGRTYKVVPDRTR